MNKKSLLNFSKTLSAHFSNYKQSQANPSEFSHINIFFRPLLDFQLLGRPSFYSEQSYDYDPWRPYRQGLHFLDTKADTIILENFEILSPMRFAGGGRNSSLLNKLSSSKIKKREGCAMHFYEVSPGHYKGQVEPGNSCIVKRQGVSTYLESNVELNANSWVSHDLGRELETNKQIWGGRNGPHYFNRICDFGDKLTEDWLYS